jgi:excisionase family DNA binding protein
MTQSRKKIINVAKEPLPAAFFTVKELAIYFKISPRMVRKLIGNRELGFVKIGSRIVVPTTAIRKFLEEHYVKCWVGCSFVTWLNPCDSGDKFFT